MNIAEQMRLLAENAQKSARALAKLSPEMKNKCLLAMADGLEKNAAAVKSANQRDMDAGRKAGLSKAVLDRLLLDDKRIASMAKAIREIVNLPDPVGQIIDERTRPNGLRIQRVRVPLGVILIIYESRPNVTADAASLCFKSGNAVILRGGSEALHSNLAIADAMMNAAKPVGMPENAIQVVPTTDREAISELLKLDSLINLVIPRGGESLIRAVAEQSRIPVIKHYKGVCHVFVDREADLDMAEKIVVNAKCQRPGVCNAMETLLIDAPLAGHFLPRIEKALRDRGVEIIRDADFTTEYLDLKLSLRVVNGVDEAIDHITKYGSAHTDSIVTRNEKTARKFLNEVDSATVLWNASTRFSDGGEFGLGAEIGISTDKLHARGPMGLEELTSYKWVVFGEGQIRQ